MTGEELYAIWAEEVEEHPTDLGALAWDEVPGDERAAWDRLAEQLNDKPKADVVATHLPEQEES